jgi:hypothetical protein
MLDMRSLVVAFAILLLGCPPADKKEKKETTPTACTKVGQSCEFSPGKLGTCVQKDGCTGDGPACFVCQSQH